MEPEYQSKRRTSAVGGPMLVNLPTSGYENTGEGGLAFFLLVPQKKNFDERRQVCIAGEILWPQQDVVVLRDLVPFDENDESTWEQNVSSPWDRPQTVDGGLLIGSTGLSLCDDLGCFCPQYDDLTAEGKQLYDMLKKLYGEVEIVTLLDT